MKEKQIIVHFETRREREQLEKKLNEDLGYITEKYGCIRVFRDSEGGWVYNGDFADRDFYEREFPELRIVSTEEFINGQSNNINQKTIMNKVTAMLKRLLDEDAQTLYKVGYINGDMELTDKGRRAIDVLVFDKYKKNLVALAEEEIEEEKENE